MSNEPPIPYRPWAKPKLSELVKELHQRMKNITDKTVLPKDLKDIQAYYNFYRRGQLNAYESTIKAINKVYGTTYEEEIK